MLHSRQHELVLKRRLFSLPSLVLPSGLANLETLDLHVSSLTSLTLPAGLSQLKRLDFSNTPALKSLFVREDLAISIPTGAFLWKVLAER